MPRFGHKSRQRLEELHPDLQTILEEAIKVYDFTILEGYRDMLRQNKLFDEGKSKLRYPKSKHNRYPSHAVDLSPWPIDWEDTKRFYYLAGIIQGIAAEHDIAIRFGGDWDRDGNFNDNKFNDLVHFELYDYGYKNS